MATIPEDQGDDQCGGGSSLAGDVSRDCMRVTIRRALIQRIIRGVYVPGDRLIELKIAAEFGTSQGPVREALRELEAMRLVETERFRGTRVRAVSPEEMAEAAWVRGILETEAARLAVPALKGKTDALRAETAALIDAARSGRLDDYAQHNEEFHRILVLAAANEQLLRTWDSLLLEARTRVQIEHAGAILVAVAETHDPIVEALHQGDAPLAGVMLREHAEVLSLDMTDPRVADYIRRGGRPKIMTHGG